VRELEPATQADRLHSIRLRGCWPPSTEKRPASHRETLPNFQPSLLNLNGSIDTTGTVRRAIEKALVRAAILDRDADALLAGGLHHQAERLAHRAAELREVTR
jgi:hypothetical protein